MLRTDERHPATCLSCMVGLRKDNKLCDVVIQVDPEGRQFLAHRIVLAGSSPYFQAMFAGEMEESKQTVVTIRDIPASIMEVLLDYCYTSTVEITEDNVQYLLPAAGILQLGWVKDVCCEFIKHQLDSTNCLGIRAFADTHSCPELQEAADCYAQQHYLEVLESGEFLELSSEELGRLLESEDLNVQSEEQVFESVMRWVRYDIEARKKYLADVLKHVRLPLLERRYLVSRVGTEPLIRQDEECRDLVDEAKNYLLLPEQRSVLEGPRTRPRKPMKSDEVLYAVGGWCSGDAISMVERYSVHTDEWKVVATMSKRRCGVGVAVLADFLYAIGGHDGSSYLNSVERYDPRTNQWASSPTPTSSCRTSVGVGVLEGCVYAVGGQDGVSCLNIVERYDPSTNQWAQVCPMGTRRLGVAVAVLRGHLYAIGGSDGTTPLETVERYDLKTNRWSPVASMQSKRKHLGVAVLDSMIYAVGGRDESTELSSVERYDASTDTWHSVVAMNSRRSGVGLCVVNGRLFAVGGFDGMTYLKSIEWLDHTHKQWKLSSSMNYRRLGCGVGVARQTCSASIS